MTLRAIDAPETDKGPLDDAARALLERILALRPLALAIVYETAVMRDFDCLPNLEMLHNGLEKTVAEIIADRKGGE